jgi:3'(2'), 5'-bisphosphate nucleotidase
MTNLGDGGLLQYELNAAISIVQKASFVSRSLQHTLLLKGVESMSKDDKSPVTIADFVVQALIIRKLHEIFPHDRFIAEESSEFLKQNKMISDKVLFSLNSISDFLWTDKMLYETVDLGQYDYNASDSNSINRIWVLDPVDGTKGFMRGEHYCIALALLSPEKKPMMSVMGCPNINYKNVLESSTGNNKKISNIEPVIEVILDEDGSKIDAHVGETGTIFFSVSNRGSFVRSLSMLAGSAYEVSVKESLDPTNLTLCESVEASHGDRGLTEAVYKQMKLKNDFLRLDGQCKYAIVGAGGADGNMRLPPLGYIEKIWDHAPGTHFVIEAGGKVTDLNGILLDFGQGRLLPKCVTGIVASTGGELHDKILESIRISSKGVSNNENKRVFGQDSNK